MTYSTNATTWTYNGMIIDADKGERPAKTPQQLLVSRAVEAKDGWLGQIVMAGEIVWETKPMEDSEDALEEVNKRIIARFKKLIVG